MVKRELPAEKKHYILRIFKTFLKFLFFNCVYVHISNLNYKNILILKKWNSGISGYRTPLNPCSHQVTYLRIVLDKLSPYVVTIYCCCL